MEDNLTIEDLKIIDMCYEIVIVNYSDKDTLLPLLLSRIHFRKFKNSFINEKLKESEEIKNVL